MKKRYPKISFAFILFCFFGSNKRLIKSLQFLLTFLNGGEEKSYYIFYSSVSPENDWIPPNKIYIKIPHDHLSHFSSYKLSTTSGEQ